MVESEKVKILRKYLEKRITQLKEELEMLELILSLVESGVISGGAELRAALTKPPKPGEKVYPITTDEEEHVADIYMGKTEVRIVPLVKLPVNISPFKQFLVNKVLEGMRKRDLDMVRKGLLPPEKAMEYVIETDGEILKEIHIKNVFNEKRKVELKSAARWTLIKMYEKTRKSR